MKADVARLIVELRGASLYDGAGDWSELPTAAAEALSHAYRAALKEAGDG